MPCRRHGGRLPRAVPELEEEAGRRRDIVFLALDLVAGRVDAEHPLYGWLRSHGAPAAALDALGRAAERPDVVGLNLYPLFTRKRLLRNARGQLRIRMPYTEDGLIEGVVSGSTLTGTYVEMGEDGAVFEVELTKQ